MKKESKAHLPTFNKADVQAIGYRFTSRIIKE